MMSIKTILLGGMLSVMYISTAGAAISAQEAARLGTELTPMGAIKAGNADGNIPAWTGGITQPPAGYQPGAHHIDPFSSDKIKFTIDASNLEQYKDKISPGQIAMLKKYPSFKINVYPTHEVPHSRKRFMMQR